MRTARCEPAEAHLAYSVPRTRLKGITKKLHAHFYPSYKHRGKAKRASGGSSLRQGMTFDSDIERWIDSIHASDERVFWTAHPRFHRLTQDMKTMHMIPVTSQLICYSLEKRHATAVDIVTLKYDAATLRPLAVCLVETKTGYCGDLFAYDHRAQRYLSNIATAPAARSFKRDGNHVLNHHVLQLISTFALFATTFFDLLKDNAALAALPVQLYLAYIDRAPSALQLEPPMPVRACPEQAQALAAWYEVRPETLAWVSDIYAFACAE